VSVRFYGGSDPDLNVSGSSEATVRAAASWTVHPEYLGTFFADQNDIAVVRLTDAAPSWAWAYKPNYTPLTAGLSFNVAGYGVRSSIGGTYGFNLSSGRLRQGNNRFEFRWGDDMFYDVFTDPEWFGPQAAHTWVSDFDSGEPEHDAACEVGSWFGYTEYCDLGDALEVAIGPGDSGGPEFVNGRIAAVTSYYYTLGYEVDYRDGLNASFSEFSGFVPLYLHRDFFMALLVPEPATAGLLAPGLLGLVGVMWRRRVHTRA
jgi:hypothetical protein